jgi:hypothetical protein
MSWLFSRALEAEFSAATCSAGELSAPSSVMPTQHPFWWRDKTMDFSIRSPFGQTLPVSTADHGEELLTWYRGASRVRTSALPAKAPELMVLARASGGTWRASLAKFDRASSSWRTAQQSFFGESDESSVTWPRSGMTVDGQCWELAMSALRMSVNDSGLWVPTPCATDAKPITGGNLYVTRTGTVRHMRPDGKSSNRGLAASAAMWPTPLRSDARSPGLSKTRQGGQSLSVAVRVATPTRRDWKSGKASAETMARNSRPLSEQIGGLLNPAWVEWLMNWPIGWTELSASATDRSPCAPQPLSESSQEAETA